MPKPKVRTGSPSVQLAKEEFFRRARERFYDPTFAAFTPQIESVLEAAWRNYAEYHKSPRTRKAGAGFSDPEFPLAVEWLETRKNVLSRTTTTMDRTLAGVFCRCRTCGIGAATLSRSHACLPGNRRSRDWWTIVKAFHYGSKAKLVTFARST